MPHLLFLMRSAHERSATFETGLTIFRLIGLGFGLRKGLGLRLGLGF